MHRRPAIHCAAWLLARSGLTVVLYGRTERTNVNQSHASGHAAHERYGSAGACNRQPTCRCWEVGARISHPDIAFFTARCERTTCHTSRTAHRRMSARRSGCPDPGVRPGRSAPTYRWRTRNLVRQPDALASLGPRGRKQRPARIRIPLCEPSPRYCHASCMSPSRRVRCSWPLARSASRYPAMSRPPSRIPRPPPRLIERSRRALSIHIHLTRSMPREGRPAAEECTRARVHP